MALMWSFDDEKGADRVSRKVDEVGMVTSQELFNGRGRAIATP